jgi:hypothetical protein
VVIGGDFSDHGFRSRVAVSNATRAVGHDNNRAFVVVDHSDPVLAVLPVAVGHVGCFESRHRIGSDPLPER